MWHFSTKRELPGISLDRKGRITFTLTDQEETEVNSFLRMLKKASESDAPGTLYLHPDAHKAITAWALIGYAQKEVFLADAADTQATGRNTSLHKALAAALKAYSLHAMPIYLFDTACILEMLGDAASARENYVRFLELQGQFEPSSVDRIPLAQRDIDAAIARARRKVTR